MAFLRFKDYGKFIFLIVFLFFIYGSYRIIAPFLADILAAIVLAIVCYPLYAGIFKKIKKKNFSAILVVIIVLILITIPGMFFANALLHEAINIYNSVGSLDLPAHSARLKEITGLNVEFDRYLTETIREFSNVFINSSTQMIRFLATGFIHIFTTFFLMFFFLRDGKNLASVIKKGLPLSSYQKTRLFKGTGDLINGIFLGFLAIGIAEFLAALLGFYIFGIPNPLLWALIVAIFAYIPLLGPAAIWVPAAIYLFLNGHTQSAILLIVYFGAILSFYMDNILRAQLIEKTAKIHPAISILGIFGGLSLFGIVGLIVGPLILSLFVLLYRLYLEENVNS
jgi:predicted PurR-regulated permease PerM